VNGKDKVLALGAQPKITGPVGKLASVRLPGTLLKDGVANVIGIYSEGEIQYILPEGLPKNAPNDAAAIWKTAKLSNKKAANDKTPTDVSVGEFVAFLPGGAEELTRLCQDERALEILGGKGKVFPTQLEWLEAVVKANAANPAMAPLEKYVARAMRQRYEQFENGTGGVDVLEQGLKFAALSQDLYPTQPEQQQLRKSLTDRKVWLDRKLAVLRTFLAAKEWDAFLLGDRDFEKYQQAYPEMAKKYSDALNQSLQLHRQAGDDRLKEGEFGSAYREFRVAAMRQPSDKVMQQRVSMAWTDYSRRVAIDRQGARKQLSAGQREAIGQALRFATGYKEQNKLDLALNSVLEAAAIDPESLPVLLKKAEVLGAQHQFTKALETLDLYDQLAIDEERKPASDLRNDLLFKRTSTVEDIKAQFPKLWAESRFYKIRDLATEGLRAKDDDAELLDNGGRASLITRSANDGRALLARYLEVSNTLDANSEQRVRVRRLLATIPNSTPAEQGEANWMSGKKLPKGVFYCPASLAFQPKVERIDAGKLKVSYEWAGDRLRAIIPTFEKNERLTSERKISFAYDDKASQIASVAYEDAAKAPSGTDADEIFRQSSLVLINNPYVDPVAVEKLTQKNVAIGIAGNRFFQPFVWDKIHYFELTYDSSGRVAQAREVADPKAAPGDTLLEFEWDGLQLAAVRGYQGDEKRRVMIYERTLEYQDGRLISEAVESQGKSSHIKYTYNGNRLVSAESGADLTLDNRNRKIFFLN
jgi:hypothetical protein